MNDEEDKDRPKDPDVEARIDRAIGPLAAFLPAADLAALRDDLRDVLEDDPTLSELHRAARPRVVPVRSGTTSSDPEAAAPADTKTAAVVPLRKRRGAA